jgi:hypothetical protein
MTAPSVPRRLPRLRNGARILLLLQDAGAYKQQGFDISSLRRNCVPLCFGSPRLGGTAYYFVLGLPARRSRLLLCFGFPRSGGIATQIDYIIGGCCQNLESNVAHVALGPTIAECLDDLCNWSEARSVRVIFTEPDTMSNPVDRVLNSSSCLVFWWLPVPFPPRASLKWLPSNW